MLVYQKLYVMKLKEYDISKIYAHAMFKLQNHQHQHSTSIQEQE